jgi:hypothetical protein
LLLSLSLLLLLPLLCPFVCHSAAKRRNLLLLLLLSVVAVILSEAKDPETLHPPLPLEPFNPKTQAVPYPSICPLTDPAPPAIPNDSAPTHFIP